jgi:hypothetical protein
VKGRVNYTIGFPIKYPIASSNQRYFVGSLPKMRVHSIEHLGPTDISQMHGQLK